LFEGDVVRGTGSYTSLFDQSPSSGPFLMIKSAEDEQAPSIVFVQNWAAELGQETRR
jgi:hypothetical protein